MGTPKVAKNGKYFWGSQNSVRSLSLGHGKNQQKNGTAAETSGGRMLGNCDVEGQQGRFCGTESAWEAVDSKCVAIGDEARKAA